MAQRAVTALTQLERCKTDYTEGSGPRKLALLGVLARRRLTRARDVVRLHDVLCFLRAYPDDASVLTQVERMLATFADRGDTRRFRHVLENTGIAGTAIEFRFYPPTAEWLARRWGAHLTIDWDGYDWRDRLEPLLAVLGLHSESPALDEFTFDVREWLSRMRRPTETDAEFLVRRLAHARMDPLLREALLEQVDVPFRLAPGADTPSRSREKLASVTPAWQIRPLRRGRPRLRTTAAVPPQAVRSLSPRDGAHVIDLARSAMAVRTRDLDAFAYGDRHDVRLVDHGDGRQLALIGVTPQRRFLLETLYGFLALQNGVPVGYGTYTALFGSAEVAFTVFDTYRAGEAAHIYGRVIATAVHLLGCDTFAVIPYQLGQDNADAIQSGAWWFYQKFGFRPRDPALLRLMRRELGRMRADRAYRSSASTLERLASDNVYCHLGARRDDVIGMLPLANVGLRVTAFLAERFGSDRHLAETACSRDAARLLGVRPSGRFAPEERRAWARWSPLIMTLPAVTRWNKAHRRALAAVVRAKGGRRESEYLARFDRHRLLRRAILRLADPDRQPATP